MILTDEEIRLIKIVRMVRCNERAYLTIENRDSQMNLIHKFTDTFDYINDEELNESIKFVDFLRCEFPNLINGLIEFGDK